MSLQKVEEGIWRVIIPFEDITTTVYILEYDEGVAIIDSGKYPSDVDGYVMPACLKLGIDAERVRFILLTHTHSDHAGGLLRLCELFPLARVGFISELCASRYSKISDGEVLLGGLRVVLLPGHTADSTGYFDLRTGTLLSGDCLQLRGIGKYRQGVKYPDLYKKSLGRLREMGIRRIVASHEYDPLGSVALGAAAVGEYLDECIRAASLRQ